jgi:hypothetical protein
MSVLRVRLRKSLFRFLLTIKQPNEVWLKPLYALLDVDKTNALNK